MEYPIINLKKNLEFVNSYVQLRNLYKAQLCTHDVTVDETKKWLFEKNVEVFCLVDQQEVIGAIILHGYKDNEVTIFVKQIHKGFGSTLLEYLEKFAKANSLSYLWAWTKTNNVTAQKLFLKHKFIRGKNIKTNYDGEVIEGIKFVKKFI